MNHYFVVKDLEEAVPAKCLPLWWPPIYFTTLPFMHRLPFLNSTNSPHYLPFLSTAQTIKSRIEKRKWRRKRIWHCFRMTLLSSCLDLRFHVQKLKGEQDFCRQGRKKWWAHSQDRRQIHTNEVKNKMLQVKEMVNSEFLDLDSNLEANRCDLLVENTDSSTRNLIFYVIFKLSYLRLWFYCP